MRFPTLTCGLVLATLGAWYLASPTGSEQQQRAFWFAVLDTRQPLELWRAVTAHLLHVDGNHLTWNLGALALLGGLIEQSSARRLCLALAVGSTAVVAWFFLFAPTAHYCGWSGVLNALLVVALYGLYLPGSAENVSMLKRRCNNALLLLIAAGALAKNLYELRSGISLVSSSEWQTTPGAHLAGLVGGLILVAWYAAQRVSARAVVRVRRQPPTAIDEHVRALSQHDPV